MSSRMTDNIQILLFTFEFGKKASLPSASFFTDFIPKLTFQENDAVCPATQELKLGSDLLMTFSYESKSHGSLRTYESSNTVILTLNCILKDTTQFESRESVQELRNLFTSLMKSEKCNCLPTSLKINNLDVWNYYISGSNRLLEIDYDKCVFEADSKYQNIKIMHSINNGNVLILDDDVMLGESDDVYTKSLMGLDRGLDYKDKSVLILGAGDGGLLFELLKTNVKHVTMVEIDVEVINASKKYLREICGDALDSFSSDRHKIIVGDCLDFMKTSSQVFDVVINDLTELAIHEDQHQSFVYDLKLTSSILDLALKRLARNGVYLSRGNVVSCKNYLEACERLFNQAATPMSYEKFVAFVPSFCELYAFYQAV